jgi:hypothetical protein
MKENHKYRKVSIMSSSELEFPSSISVVSDCIHDCGVDCGVDSVIENSAQSVTSEVCTEVTSASTFALPPKSTPLTQALREFNTPTTINLLNLYFADVFPAFKATSVQGRDMSTGELYLQIPFVWIENTVPRSGTLAFLLKKTAGYSWRASFDTFLSTPNAASLNNPINWSQLYYVDFKPAFYQAENLFALFPEVTLS